MKLVNKMRVNKFVLDTNIWISYFITRSEDILLDIVDKNALTIFSCTELIDEITRVLNYPHLSKFKVDIKIAIGTVRSITTHFELTYPIKKYIPGDIKDDYLIALALQTNSGFITSGDQHIIAEKDKLERRFTKLKILTKAEFENRFPST